MKRRLAAILAADVVGYSRLIGADEAGTLTMLRELRRDLVEPTLKRHHGRVVKFMGDGLLAEFASVVDAVAAAVDIQGATPERSSHLPEDRRVALRIGVNIGDVVVEDGDLFGDGVNVAARLQEVADPNGVAISDDVYRQLSGKLDLPFQDAGEKALKNIKQAVRTWLWSPTNTFDDVLLSDSQPALPNKPSIAVLPFDNMSGDPEQEYFSDGITEDIITELSRYRELFVIARNSTSAYKGRVIDIRQVAKELGVRHVLEGSVRRAGKRVRVTAQLIDTESGSHIWAERYDRNLEDIFAVQDEITAVMVNTLLGKLTHREYERALHKRPEALGAYDHALRATVLFQKFNPSDNALARREAELAAELDPGFARAHALIAWTYTVEASLRWVDNPAASFQRGYEFARRAVALDDEEPWAQGALGFADVWGNHAHERGVMALERAVSLNPNNAHFRGWLSNVLCFSGRTEDAMMEIETAMRLNPHYSPIYLHFLARILLTQRRYAEAVPHLEQVVNATPENTNAMALLAACYAGTDRRDEAKAMVQKIQAVSPTFLLSALPSTVPYAQRDDMDHYLYLLRKAGLPE